MPAEQLIFVGFEMTDEMEAEFDGCKGRDRVYIEDPTHLEIAAIDGRRYVGKRVSAGAAQDRLEDTARSVVSLIARVCGDVALKPNQAVLIAVEEQLQPAAATVIEA